MAIKPDEILIAEFEYIAHTAFQANEDRAKVTTYYLVTLGTLVAGILTSQVMHSTEPGVFCAFAALFAVLSAASVVILLQVVRLRQAWFDSVLAMNDIKSYYLRYGQDPNLATAFRWTTSSLPDKFKPWSISSLMAMQVALLGGVTLGAAVMFLGRGFEGWWWPWAILAGVLVFGIQVALYGWLLRD